MKSTPNETPENASLTGVACQKNHKTYESTSTLTATGRSLGVGKRRGCKAASKDETL